MMQDSGKCTTFSEPSLDFTPKQAWQPNTTSNEEKEGKNFMPLLSLNQIVSINLQVLQAHYAFFEEKRISKRHSVQVTAATLCMF